ncbi:MAG: 16S rRNA (cytosine(967)-C(5))-methyltransferase RsmB [Nitrospinota bacterium]
MASEAKAEGRRADPIRRHAFELLLRFERELKPADALLRARARGAQLSPRDRAFLRELFYGVLRWRGRLDYCLGRVLGRPVERVSLAVRVILRLGAYQLLFLERVPPHAAVDQAVRLAAERAPSAKGLVNGALRRLAREGAGEPPPEGSEEFLSCWLSHPGWLVRRWMERLGGERARARCEANNALPPLTFHVNPLRTEPGALTEALAREGLRTRPGEFLPGALQLVGQGGGDFTHTEAFRQGWFYLQDEGAALCAALAGLRPGERVWDACAAPGGKAAALTGQLAGEGLLVASDRRPGRLGWLRENCARMGLRAALLAADVRNPPFCKEFDCVLVDAPCSGFGVLRRHPDGKWRTAPEDMSRMAEAQVGYLVAAAAVVRPGGRLLYVVCSNEPEETEGVAAAFEAARPSFAREDPRPALCEGARAFVRPDGALELPPELAGTDGSYALRWVRRERC